VQRNGLNPHWEFEEAEVITSHPELAQVIISLCYRPRQSSKARVLGSTALPIACLRAGVRSVQLNDDHGAPLYFCKLLLRATMDECPAVDIPATGFEGPGRSSFRRTSLHPNLSSHRASNFDGEARRASPVEAANGIIEAANGIIGVNALRRVVEACTKLRRSSVNSNASRRTSLAPATMSPLARALSREGSRALHDPEPVERLIPAEDSQTPAEDTEERDGDRGATLQDRKRVDRRDWRRSDEVAALEMAALPELSQEEQV